LNNEGSSYQDNLSHDSKQIREVYARYGLAMYQAQCVERQIGIIIATLNPEFFQETPDSRGCIFEKEFKKTLGNMVEIMRKKMVLDSKFEKRLQDALELRNWLAHNYFWERAILFLNSDGREIMIEELQSTADNLAEIDCDLNYVTDEWLSKVGMSKETIEMRILKYMQKSDG